MKLIISMQDGSLYMLSVSQITDLVFGATELKVWRITGEQEIYLYMDIKSIVIA